jgi:putative ABC transport system permease protein
MRAVTRILNNVTLAVSFIGAFVLLSGVLILVGSIAMTKWQRIYEAAVLKTLGAKRKTLIAIMLAEYGLLGLTAGTVGTLAAVALSYALSRYVFELSWNHGRARLNRRRSLRPRRAHAQAARGAPRALTTVTSEE